MGPPAPPRASERSPDAANVYGCIDIGSNTTRLLVARGGPFEALVEQRSFSHLGRSLDATGLIPATKITETAAVVAAQARHARDHGATTVVAVATAAVREARNGRELAVAVERAAGMALTVLESREEARLSFVGATRTLPEAAHGPVAVVDVGGGSTEIAVGVPDGTPEWSRSVRIGSSRLAEHLTSDPPSASELDVARGHARAHLAGLAPPRAVTALAVGGSATSLNRMVGERLDEPALEQALELLCAEPAADIARRFGLAPQRVRLLPAGIVVLGAVCRCLGRPLRIARGGLREGVLLELMDGAGPGPLSARPGPVARADAGAP